MSYPILEYDPSRTAIIEPSILLKPIDISEYCVITFFREVIEKVVSGNNVRKVFVLKSEASESPVYEIDFDGKRVAFIHSGVGAPSAAALLEELIALGCRKFIACGSAGVLDRDIQCGKIVIPTSAIRDEGVSYHYLPPSREVAANPMGIEAIKNVLSKHSIDFLLSKTWTTDGVYRETIEKVNKRKSEGCLTVEMEAAAFFAVAEFRGVVFAQMLYGGDDVSCEEWDHRDFLKQHEVREKLFWLSAEACLQL
ncbi:MAG: nucleoside phosphorylase [Bacillota bacterium]